MTELAIDKNKPLLNIAHIGYGLQTLGFFFFIPALIASVILGYLKKNDANNTWLESHFKWQIKTFWFYMLVEIIGFILTFLLIGFIILFINHIWLIYRIIKGWLALNTNTAVN